MNFIRSLLIALALVASGLHFSSDTAAQTTADQARVPVRLAAKETSVGELIRSRRTEILLASDETDIDDEVDFLELDDQGDDQADQERKRQESMMSRIAALRKPVTQIAIRASADGLTPQNRAEQLSVGQPMIAITALGIGPTPPNRYTVCFMHRPLYFEQRNLERCGNGCGCWQNGVSGVQFLGNTMLLPYHLGQQRCNCTVPSGGDCQSCQSYPVDCDLHPFDLRGLTVQAAAVAGFTFLLL